MQVTKGYLLISDITGYTEFLVGSELDHATEILQALLQVTIDAVRAPSGCSTPEGMRCSPSWRPTGSCSRSRCWSRSRRSTSSFAAACR